PPRRSRAASPTWRGGRGRRRGARCPGYAGRERGGSRRRVGSSGKTARGRSPPGACDPEAPGPPPPRSRPRARREGVPCACRAVTMRIEGAVGNRAKKNPVPEDGVVARTERRASAARVLDRFLPDLGRAELDHLLRLLGGDDDLLAGLRIAARPLRPRGLHVTAEDTEVLQADAVAL